MAARFAECSNKLIENLKEKSKNKNTTVSTNNWLKVWKTWAKQAGHSDEIKSYKPEEFEVCYMVDSDGDYLTRYEFYFKVSITIFTINCQTKLIT